jgi:hypothetical protein
LQSVRLHFRGGDSSHELFLSMAQKYQRSNVPTMITPIR